MSRKHIYDKDIRYSFIYPIVGFCVRHSYRKVEVTGEENIPSEGAQIACPNHCNTLMDALVMLRGYKKLTVFGARADIFRKRLAARFLTFARILPLMRQRDGIRNVLQNNKTQEIIVDTLKNNVRFCLFPEGTHRTKHSLQVLGKGAMRIALAANEEFGKEKPVYLLPVGLEYGDYFRYRSTSLITYGKPINVTEFIKNNQFDSEPQIIDALRKALSQEMTQLMTYIPFDDKYEGKWVLTKMMAIEGSRRGYGDRFTKLSASMAKNREIVKSIEEKLAENPEQMSAIIERSEKFEAQRKSSKVSIYSFRKNNKVLSVIFKTLSAIIGLPYFVFSAIVSLPMWAVETKIRKGIKDLAFGNTVSFGVKLGVGLVLFLIYAPLAFCLAPWWLALALIALWIPSYSYFHDYLEGCRRWISDIRLLLNRQLEEEFQSIVKDYKQL